MSTAASDSTILTPPAADRFGVFASVICAIHCLVTPPLLLLLATFGRAWAHPSSHWAMALLVVPLAFMTMRRGFRIHRRRWVIVSGSLRIAFILVGAALPYMGEEAPPANSDVCSSCESCCPPIQDAGGDEARLVIPPASIVTTLGGLLLVLTHLGNLCRCCPPASGSPHPHEHRAR